MNDSSSPSRKLRYQLKPILCIAHWNTIVFVTLFLLTYHSSDVALEDNNIVLYSRCVCVGSSASSTAPFLTLPADPNACPLSTPLVYIFISVRG